MGWISKVDYVPPHECNPPSLEPYDECSFSDDTVITMHPPGPGSVWECDDCGTRWRVFLYQFLGRLEWEKVQPERLSE